MFTRARRGWVIQRCQNKNPRLELRPGGRHAPEAWAEDLGIWEKAVSWVSASERESWDSDPGEARRLCALRAPRVGWVESWRCKSSQHRKIVSLSPHIEKPLNSKRWIKVSYLNQFRVFGFLYMFMNILWSYVYFTNPYHGYVTIKLEVQDDIFISIYIRKSNYKNKGFYSNKSGNKDSTHC